MTEYAPIIEINCETGERIIRQPSEQEIAQMQKDAEDYAKFIAIREAEAQAKSAAKQSAQEKLKALGLTDVEILAITGI